MTFYKKHLGGAIVYITPDDRAYRIPIYSEEYPDGHTEAVSGTASQVRESRKERFVEDADEIDRLDVPLGVILALERTLSEHQAP